MFDWMESLFSKKPPDAITMGQSTYKEDDSSDTGSLGEANAKRQQERDMQDRLDAFMSQQKKLDKKGDKLFDDKSGFTESDKKRAEGKFNKQESDRTKSETPITTKDLGDEIFLLEGSGRLVPQVGNSGQVLTMLGGGPEFADSDVLPSMTGAELGMVLQITDPGSEVAEWGWLLWK